MRAEYKKREPRACFRQPPQPHRSALKTDTICQRSVNTTPTATVPQTGQEKFQEDTIIPMEFFTEFITFIRLIPNYPVEDEFLREMRRFDKTPDVSFQLVLTAQIFLDIHHTIRAATQWSFEAMAKESGVMVNSLERHQEFHENLKIDHWPSFNDRKLREFSRLIKWMGEDPVHGAKAELYARMGRTVPSEMEVHRILIYSPVLSGLFLFRLRAEMYDVGLAVANAWGSITYTAHLYNALQRTGLWGSRPPPSQDAADAGHQRGRPVSSMFNIVARRAYQQKGSLGSGDLIMTQIDNPQELRARDRLRKQKAKARTARKDWTTGGLVPEGLAATLSVALECESLEMAFPYLATHRWCWSLLRSVKEACDSVPREPYQPAYTEEKDTELPWVVGYILMAAAGVGEAPDLMLLHRAAESCNAMIGSEAGMLAISVRRSISKNIQFREKEPWEGRDISHFVVSARGDDANGPVAQRLVAVQLNYVLQPSKTGYISVRKAAGLSVGRTASNGRDPLIDPAASKCKDMMQTLLLPPASIPVLERFAVECKWDEFQSILRSENLNFNKATNTIRLALYHNEEAHFFVPPEESSSSQTPKAIISRSCGNSETTMRREKTYLFEVNIPLQKPVVEGAESQAIDDISTDDEKTVPKPNFVFQHAPCHSQVRLAASYPSIEMT
ncbi:Ank-repeat protein mbp1 [Colletotrichum higginsianum IMI 349063]|uniref:Ank-repeat protein mbp1 n=1 Tax=Colletotrichum higginsianum (strain IMI 349063) TaxID=759273 RepID=A0A1B7XQT7_COLHI|nr:Ank-repeat protein mbp1 [Colletotrichum higginsianum IMI 349063]OBR02126.1 Ank-repeat protein mbp1 [Colletotrichum higginsianum IMI 349063]